MKKVQEIASKRIKRLFIQASKNSGMSKRYIFLAKKIAMRANLKIAPEFKKLYCHKCLVYLMPGNSIIRIKKGFKIIKCQKCGHYNRQKLK